MIFLRKFAYEQIKQPVVLAIALSLLIHAVLLLGPNLIHLSPVLIPELPPLTARLEPLPHIIPAPKPHPKPHPKPKPKPVETPVIPAEPLPQAAEEIAPPPEEVAASNVIPSEEAPPVKEIPPPLPVEIRPAHPLPKLAQLTFNAYKGTSFKIGEARQHLEIKDDKSYILQVGMNTTGIASLFKTFELSQQSSGKVSASGLRPDEFTENKVTSKGQQALTATFDWEKKQLAFSSGNQSTLPEQAQDILSFLYQFSQMPLDQSTLSMHVSNGKKLESYQLEVGSEEDIQTPIGKVHALPLRKIHAPGEEGLEVWLGMEYRLLPVKVVQIDRNGEIAGQLVISDIRVSEETQ